MEKSSMDEKKILALMYDFYNEHILRGQNNDINYYIEQIKKYQAKKVLVVGSGTGRVAIPLSKYTFVTALDFDEARLEVLKEKEKNVKTICVNFLNYKTNNKFDLIIIPYSTLQFDNDLNKLNKFFENLYQIMTQNTILIFDVSKSFNTKVEKNREFLFKDYSSKVEDEIEVYYSAKRFDEYIEFLIEYKMCNKNIKVFEHEKYYYYEEEKLLKLINDNNFKLLKIDYGYGNNEFKHKHLYHCRKL